MAVFAWFCSKWQSSGLLNSLYKPLWKIRFCRKHVCLVKKRFRVSKNIKLWSINVGKHFSKKKKKNGLSGVWTSDLWKVKKNAAVFNHYVTRALFKLTRALKAVSNLGVRKIERLSRDPVTVDCRCSTAVMRWVWLHRTRVRFPP